MGSPFRDSEERRRVIRRVIRLAAFGLTGLAAFYALFGGDYPLQDLVRLHQDVKGERAAEAQLAVEVDSLRRVRDALRDDPSAMEREARERYGLIRDGETLYRFVGPDGSEWSADLP